MQQNKRAEQETQPVEEEGAQPRNRNPLNDERRTPDECDEEKGEVRTEAIIQKRLLEVGCALRAADGLYRDLRKAERTILFGGFCWCGRLDEKLVGGPNDQVDDETDNQKIDDAVEKKAIIQGGSSGSLGIREGLFKSVPDRLMKRLLKSTFPRSSPIRGENDIRHQRVDNLGECRANYHANGQVQDIAAHDKGLKFFEHLSSFLFAFFQKLRQSFGVERGFPVFFIWVDPFGLDLSIATFEGWDVFLLIKAFIPKLPVKNKSDLVTGFSAKVNLFSRIPGRHHAGHGGTELLLDLTPHRLFGAFTEFHPSAQRTVEFFFFQ